MKICPKCGKVLSFNSYFGAYICTNCNWEDSRRGQTRNKGLSSLSYQITGKKKEDSIGKLRILCVPK